tara:strand:+ start:3878 stop:5140 length:1263 start_codon:yes stop_codon:yes gene_type:complete
MEAYAKALNFGIPFFTLLILLELVYGVSTKRITANLPDTISSLSSGIANITKDILGLIVAVISYSWLESNYAFFELNVVWWMFPLVFVVKDFAGYWIHRFEHMVNYFWNRHMIHHSSEEYNLACALRQSISQIFSLTIFILFPLALLGVPTEVFAIVAPMHLFAQFWYHTQHINRMGVLEKVIVTPSHHRVHHAINEIYLDRNFSQIFIVWDKWFGTFQEELEEEVPVYGVKKAVATWNPILINFQHAWRIWLDFFRTKSWKDKARIWFMPTGWRPDDVAEKYPIQIIENPRDQVKYMPLIPVWIKVWSGFQLLSTLITAMFLFNNIVLLTFGHALLIGAFIFLTIYSYTTIMDGKRYAAFLEIFKGIMGMMSWYLLESSYNFGSFWVILMTGIVAYQSICIGLSVIYLLKAEIPQQVNI